MSWDGDPIERESGISEDAVRRFAKAYEEEFGEPIEHGEARIMLGRMVALYSLLSRPPPEHPDERSG